MDIGIKDAVASVYPQIVEQLKQRSASASYKLRNAELEVLRGQRSGRIYKKPGTGRVKYLKRSKTVRITYRTYTASAPGEPPAVRTNALRSSFRPVISTNMGYGAAIESNLKYGPMLDEGTSRMAKRPITEPVIEKARPEIEALYTKPFKIKI